MNGYRRFSTLRDNVEYGFLAKGNQSDSVEIIIIFLDRTVEVYSLRLGWNMNGGEFIVYSGKS